MGGRRRSDPGDGRKRRLTANNSCASASEVRPFLFSRVVGIALLVLTVVLFAYATVCLVGLATSRILDYDAPYNTAVSRNLAFDGRYGLWQNGSFRVFPVECTTGPTMLVPIAAAYRFFGDSPFVPNVASLALILGLTAATWLVALPRRAVDSPWQVFALLVAMVVLVAIVMRYMDYKLLYVPMGDAPTGLLLVLATAGLGRAYQQRRVGWWTALSGVALAVAINTKFIAIMPGAVLGALLVLSVLLRWLPRAALFYWLTALATVLLGFELFRLVVLGSPAAYLGNWKEFITFFRRAGSGLTAAKPPLTQLAMSNIGRYAGAFGWCGAALLLPLPLAWPSLSRLLRRQGSGEDWTGAACALQAVLVLVWWVLMGSQGWLRHIIPGLVLLAFGSYFLIAAALQRVRSRVGRVAIAGAWPAAMIVACVFSPAAVMPLRWNPLPDTFMGALREVAARLDAIRGRDPQAKFWRIGWWEHWEAQLLMRRGFQCLDVAAPPPGTYFGQSDHDYLVLNNPVMKAAEESRNREVWTVMHVPPTFRNATHAIYQFRPATFAELSVPSASYTNGNDTLAALNHRLAPKSSADSIVPRFTWWDHCGTVEWVQYDFAAPAVASTVKVYWYDDTGGGACRVPKSWRVLYKDGDAWKPVSGAEKFGTQKDAPNRVTFTPVKTTALRLEVQLQPNFSGGVLQWDVE